MLTLLLLWTQLSSAQMPAAISLTAQDVETLRRREPVVRDSGQGLAIGIIDVNASVNALWTEVVNIEPRVQEVGPSTLCRINQKSHDRMNVTWGAGMLGMSVTFHLNYTIDHENRLLSFDLDKTKENDIAHSQGSYQVLSTPEGSRLIYRSSADPQSSMPGWMRSMLTGKPLRDQLYGIRQRAEAHPR